MNIEYEIYTLSNSGGTGDERRFVRLKTGKPLTVKQMGLLIQNAASVTSGDVKAVMSAMHDLVRHELCLGRRVYLPEIGYLSLSAGITQPEQKADGRITGRNISVRGINFKPDVTLLKEVKSGVHFVKSEHADSSSSMTDDELWAKALAHIERERYITRSDLCRECGLSDYKARLCLKSWVAQGCLTQEGTPRHRFYMLPPQAAGENPT